MPELAKGPVLLAVPIWRWYGSGKRPACPRFGFSAWQLAVVFHDRGALLEGFLPGCVEWHQSGLSCVVTLKRGMNAPDEAIHPIGVIWVQDSSDIADFDMYTIALIKNDAESFGFLGLLFEESFRN